MTRKKVVILLNIIFLLLVVLSIFINLINSTFFAIIFSYFLILLRFPLSKLYKKFSNERIIRFIILFIPYIIILYIWRLPGNYLSFNGFSLLTGGVMGFILLSVQYKGILLLVDKDYLIFFPPVSTESFVLWNYMFIGSALFQELYFRGFMMHILSKDYGLFVTLVVSTSLFLLEHFCSDTSGGKFDKIDYLNQTVISISGCLIVFFTGSVLGAVLTHLIFNLPQVVSLIIRYKFSIAGNHGKWEQE